jgi:spore coat polysaccharide biosynthesis predicted glycosyltransferase SpsG
LFVTDTNNRIAVESILKQDYWLGVYGEDEVIKRIRALQPEIVIYDSLDTNRKDIEELRKLGAVVVSFEDLGEGARKTDLTINELYDEPQFESDHILWGHRNFFLRDEFQTAQPHRFKKRVDCIMLVFGGTDQHDLSRIIFRAIGSFCREQGIYIHIVTGPGYEGYERLSVEVAAEKGVSLTHASGVISGIMEQAQLAITSNGRTVYEFAHMNIPSIVIAQHDREITHAFAAEENGFVSLGLYKFGETATLVLSALERLVGDIEFRQELFRRMARFKFDGNKKRIVKKILRLLDSTDG